MHFTVKLFMFRNDEDKSMICIIDIIGGTSQQIWKHIGKFSLGAAIRVRFSDAVTKYKDLFFSFNIKILNITS